MTTTTEHPVPANTDPEALEAQLLRTPDTLVMPRNEPVCGDALITIVDDDAYNVLVVRKMLQQAGYTRFATTTDSNCVVDMIRREPPELLLLDIMMPGLSGLEIAQIIRDGEPAISQTPIIVLTASTEREVRNDALRLGVSDFLSKPVDPCELVLRVNNTITAKARFDELSRLSHSLDELVQSKTRELEARTRQLEESRRQVIFCLARASEFRDNETGRHVIRVGKYAGLIAEQLGVEPAGCDAIEQAAQLHDVGKIGVPDAVLNKPGKLAPDEYALMQKHCSYGKEIVSVLSAEEDAQARDHTTLGANMLNVDAHPVLKMAARIALTHHEYWDGNGYPLGLAGEDIPLEGRITAVADVFDALSSRRPYKAPLPFQRCMEILEEGRGTQFDPAVLDAFVAVRSRVIEVQIKYSDRE